MKRLLLIFIIMIVFGAGAVGFVFFYLLQPMAVRDDGQSTTRLEQWLAERLRAIARANLNPEFSFFALDYEYPATVTLNDVRFADGDVALITAASITIEFTELPRIGEPIKIERIRVDQPVMRLVATPDGGLHGWSTVVAPGAANEAGQSSGSAKAGIRPSDVFAIRRIEINSASVRYEPVDEPAMKLDDLTFDLQTDPAVDQPGQYTLDVALDRENLFALHLDGQLNIDTAVLHLDALSLQTDLVPDRYEILPPIVQRFVRKHSITGFLESELTGTIPIQEAMQSTVTLKATLIDGYVASGRYTLPVKSMETTIDFSDGVATIDSLVLSALGGQATVRGEAGFVDSRDVFLNVDAEDLRLGELAQPTVAAAQEKAPNETADVVSTTTTDKPANPKYTGIINYVGTIEFTMNDPAGSLDGEGTLQVTEGKLVHVPVIGGLVRTVAGVVKPNGGNNDTLESKVQLTGTEVQLRQLKLVSQAVAARGEGEIGFDGALNFRFNAGPLEKAQDALGAVGNLFGKITDKLVTYQVTGTASQPKFNARPLGLGVTKPAESKTGDDR